MSRLLSRAGTELRWFGDHGLAPPYLLPRNK